MCDTVLKRKRDFTSDDVQKLYDWVHGDGSAFSARIFDLIGKADAANRVKIWREWTGLYNVWNYWFRHGDPDHVFRNHSIGKFAGEGVNYLSKQLKKEDK
jgi:hypothetical protein